MTIAFWCILAAIILPYIFAPIGQVPGITYAEFKEPRRRQPNLTGWRARANFAHLNGLEVLPGFAAAVIVAHLNNVPQETADFLAMTFIVARVVHGILYMANFAAMRTVAWFAGMVCVISLFAYSA